jgi:hypothetical protein
MANQVTIPVHIEYIPRVPADDAVHGALCRCVSIAVGKGPATARWFCGPDCPMAFELLMLDVGPAEE